MIKSLTQRKIKNYLDFLWAMTEKEIKVRYKRAVFGFLWVVVNPILQMLIIGFVFRFFIKEPIANYYLYLLVGLLIWNFFSLSLTKATPSIVFERTLIKKSKFPREAIPLSIILSNYFNLLIAFILLLPVVLYFGTFSFAHITGLLLALILLPVFTTGISLLTSTLNVRYRDVNFFVQAALMVWFYATPIVYSVNIIPYSLIWLWRLNPLVVIVQFFQSAFVSAPSPGIGMFIANTTIIGFTLWLGIKTFRSESKYFDDWL